ncbi:MAG: hypothetical protein ACXVP0_07245 [Bacteroidia bacterium]
MKKKQKSLNLSKNNFGALENIDSSLFSSHLPTSMYGQRTFNTYDAATGAFKDTLDNATTRGIYAGNYYDVYNRLGQEVNQR